MIDYELFCKIQHLKERDGLTCAQIAQELAIDARTVAKWLARERFCQRKPAVRESKLDPFKADITRLLERYPYSGECQERCHLEHGLSRLFQRGHLAGAICRLGVESDQAYGMPISNLP